MVDAESMASLAGDLITCREQVQPQVIVSSVYDWFSSNPLLDAMAVVEGSRPVGLITRMKMFYTLSKRFGYELHARHPIISIADSAPLTVFRDEALEMVVEKAFARQPNDIYDEIIVTDGDGYFLGILSVKQLVMQQSNALSRSVMLEEIATARAEELERLNQIKTQFLANVTHELRSPVNAIVGLAELLRVAAGKGSLEQVRERLSFMLTTATNLRGIITNILDLSKIEAGKMEVTFQAIDVMPLLQEIAETTRILVGDKPVIVTVNGPDWPVIVMSDSIKLRQIVTNLTSNAAKFTDNGAIDITLAVSDERFEIEVSDTGIGIDQKDLHLLFTPFGQLEDPAVKTHVGTGLGLAISRNLIRLIGGEITVTSTRGKGTRFNVSAPIRRH
jgi:signal transduction histidine kinase